MHFSIKVLSLFDAHQHQSSKFCNRYIRFQEVQKYVKVIFDVFVLVWRNFSSGYRYEQN